MGIPIETWGRYLDGDFSSPVVPAELDIYESFNPGSIVGVELIPTDGGKAIPIGQTLTDAHNAGPAVLRIPVSGVTGTVKAAVIHLDQTNSLGWDEIDAVQLTGVATPGTLLQWASSVSATSQYSDTQWNAMQVSGPSNVSGCGDNASAWASKAPNGMPFIWIKAQARAGMKLTRCN